MLSVSQKWVWHLQLRALFRAISRSTCRITSIEMEKPSKCLDGVSCEGSRIAYAWYWKRRKPVILSSAFKFDPEDLLVTKFIFSNLTHLDLDLLSTSHMHSPPAPASDSYWADLPETFQALKKLTSLSLNLKSYKYRSDDDYNDIAELFNSPFLTLPCLLTLKLLRFRSSGTSLSSFLRRHPTIQNLSLSYVNSTEWNFRRVPAYSPGWISLVEDMRLLRLRRLSWYCIE